jgi:hypothetical protein
VHSNVQHGPNAEKSVSYTSDIVPVTNWHARPFAGTSKTRRLILIVAPGRRNIFHDQFNTGGVRRWNIRDRYKGTYLDILLEGGDSNYFFNSGSKLKRKIFDKI